MLIPFNSESFIFILKYTNLFTCGTYLSPQGKAQRMFNDKVLGENTCHKREEKKLDDREHYTVRNFRICEF
jgi:hypothetical protein